jgi:hypothetical protein
MHPQFYCLRGTDVIPIVNPVNYAVEHGIKNLLRTKILRTEPIPGICLSTVFKSFPVNFQGNEPYVFETLVLGGEHDGEVREYLTYNDAINGHVEMQKEIIRESRYTPLTIVR